MKKKLISMLTVATIATGMISVPTFASEAYEPGKIIVTIGANNSQQQRNDLLKEFNISKADENATIISVTNQDIAKEEGYKGDINKIANENSFSSCKITLLPKGSGIQVKTHNLTQVTGNMLASALATCGINDASIDADAPFPVTGQAALAGVLMAFQKATGEEISPQKKEVANNEINTTTYLANSVGQEKAESVVNQAKEQVVKDKPQNQEEVNKIVQKAAQDNNVSLNADQQKQLDKLMNQINELKLNESEIQSTLSKIQNSISEGKKDFSEVSDKLQQEINNNSVALGKMEKILKSIKKFVMNIWNKISGETDTPEQQPTENPIPQNNNNSQSQETQTIQGNPKSDISVGTQSTN